VRATFLPRRKERGPRVLTTVHPRGAAREVREEYESVRQRLLIRFIFASSAHGGGLCLRHPRPMKLARLQELMAAF